jgi:hypothetical protein
VSTRAGKSTFSPGPMESQRGTSGTRGAMHALPLASLISRYKVYDLRRTGARNLGRADVDRDLIVRMGGCKTESVFRRSNTGDDSDLRDAVVKLENGQGIAKVNAEADAAAKPSTPPNSAIIS